METAISVFGATGFVGSAFVQKTHLKCISVARETRTPPTKNILYLISTTDNYNVFTDLHKDINTNLNVLMETLAHCNQPDLVFNFVSSWFVYGSHTQLPVPETAYCDPRGFYSITKRTAEQLLVSWCNTFGIKYRILRLSNIYGPGDAGASTKKNAIQHMVTQLYHNKPIELYENGMVYRDLLYIDDAVRAMSLVLEKGELDTIYNIGSGQPTLLRDVIDIAAHLSNSRSTISSIPTPEFHQKIQSRDFWLDTTQLQNLGFTPRVCLSQGITHLLDSISTQT
jgi:nucleoside-diphosphate-sugar epimerase